ncbi:hypothetical protein G6F43_010358 [Rhizopus delemar]|nr:hypothetical protein G6F43_010358 [Rhizopus delemar]
MSYIVCYLFNIFLIVLFLLPITLRFLFSLLKTKGNEGVSRHQTRRKACGLKTLAKSLTFVLLIFVCVVLLLLATQVTNLEEIPMAQARRVRCVALDPYKTMGVSRNATASEVKRVYKKLALLYHPDKAKGMTKEEAEECFVILTNAYEIVKSRARRNAAPPSDDLKPPSSAVLRTVLIGVGITLVVIAAHTLLKK